MTHPNWKLLTISWIVGLSHSHKVYFSSSNKRWLVRFFSFSFISKYISYLDRHFNVPLKKVWPSEIQVVENYDIFAFLPIKQEDVWRKFDLAKFKLWKITRFFAFLPIKQEDVWRNCDLAKFKLWKITRFFALLLVKQVDVWTF